MSAVNGSDSGPAQCPQTPTVQVPVAHGVPFGAMPLSVQTGVPLVQTIPAVWHGSAEVQGSPAVQALQVPAASQTWFVPQLVEVPTPPGAVLVISWMVMSMGAVIVPAGTTTARRVSGGGTVPPVASTTSALLL